ncbi:MAG TPA: bifunctional oligoribonuclease/PAP phosphatase NrnA [Vicinamibacterales bacterium]|nr:bifunctional oligoribonuclease/PAP phosphatase NrnA [Vicinamibacterales bacterium]
MTTDPHPPLLRIRDAIRQRQRFVVTSHARPDGDAIGSELAMAAALRALGKEVRVVNADPAPATLEPFPGVTAIEQASAIDGDPEAVIVMECSDLARTGVAGLDRFFVINIDHHPGNTGYGALNWFDGTAAACGEMVFDLVRALDVPLSVEIATHLYVAILTDTGSFHFSHISPRTFDICRQALEAGVDPVFVARCVYDSNTMGRLRLLGAVLNDMDIAAGGRLAVLYMDAGLTRRTGATTDDAEGLINQPLTVRDIVAVAFLKRLEGDAFRVSFRSKGPVDVSAVAKQFGGGGHRNAAGCSITMALDGLKAMLVERLTAAIDGAAGPAGGEPGASIAG